MPKKYYDHVTASYPKRLMKFEHIKYTFKLITVKHPSPYEVKAVTEKLIGKAYKNDLHIIRA